jgi:hypothetical protein
VSVQYDKNHNNDTVYVKLCYNAEMRRRGSNKNNGYKTVTEHYVYVTMLKYLDVARNTGG